MIDFLSSHYYLIVYPLYLLFLYFLGLWIFQDADRRGINGYFWSVLSVFFPIGAIPIYLIIRPKNPIKICPDCESLEVKDSVLCYYCPYNNDFINKNPGRPSFSVFILTLLKGLLKSSAMTVKYFFYFPFNQFYETCFIIKSKKLKKALSLMNRFYFLKSPVRIARKAEEELNMPYFSLTYGETPYSTICSIFKYIKINNNDIFYDLGSGMGNTVFFVNLYFNIPSAGVELVPLFVEKSRLIARELDLDNVKFIEGNFLNIDISEGTIFYLNCLTFNVELRENLFKKIKNLQSGARIISIGYPVSLPYIRLKNKITGFFSWGWEDIYIQEKYSD